MKKIFILTILTLFSFQQYMVAETTAPLVKVETTVNKVIYLLKELNPEMSETDRVNKLEQIKKAIENSFSFEQIARRSLGRNWNKLDENQQKTFMELFSKMLLTTYLKNFKGVGDAGITFEEERKLSENKVEIYSKVTVESTEFPVIYRMVLTNNEWEVYDAIVEGISLVSNYRSQFDSILNRQSPEKLLEILKEKVDSTSDQE